MYTNLFLEKLEDWEDDEVFYTREEIEEMLEKAEEEMRNETAGIQGLQDKSNS